ncbi:hypothetical protein EXQ37_18145 [Clostridium botulinum]|nr:hypothetical protein [Clostridium botulinum]MBO0561518.1 hypothetical protein [Clostridium botulinum]
MIHEDLLLLHGVTGHKKSEFNFDKLGKFKYERHFGVPEITMKDYQRDQNIFALGDEGIMYLDNSDNKITWNFWGTGYNRDFIIDKYGGSNCYFYAIYDGFISVYKNNRSSGKDTYWTFARYDARGNIIGSRYELFHRQKYSSDAIPTTIVQDEVTKNIIVVFSVETGNYESYLYVFSKELNLLHNFNVDEQYTIASLKRNIVAYNGWLYGSNMYGGSYGKYNYNKDPKETFKGMVFSGAEGSELICDPSTEIGYLPSKGRAFDLNTMVELVGQRSISITNKGDNAFRNVNFCPNGKSGYVMFNGFSNLIEVQFNPNYANLVVNQRNPNIRFMTEIYDHVPNLTPSRIMVSPSGKTLLKQEGNRPEIENKFYLYRR